MVRGSALWGGCALFILKFQTERRILNKKVAKLFNFGGIYNEKMEGYTFVIDIFGDRQHDGVSRRIERKSA